MNGEDAPDYKQTVAYDAVPLGRQWDAVHLKRVCWFRPLSVSSAEACIAQTVTDMGRHMRAALTFPSRHDESQSTACPPPHTPPTNRNTLQNGTEVNLQAAYFHQR